MHLLRLGLCLGVALAPLMTASAQTTAVPKTTASAKATETTTKETVSVTAIRPSVQVLPDRTVYSLDKNIQSSTSSLSDILRNLPSIDVDIQGNVALRGDANVMVLIDGKKSPLLAGNLADALQQLPANMVERVEVITNPSAEFRAEGSAGIINIILRKDKELVSSGIVRVNVGDQGRFNTSASGNLKLGNVRLNGVYSERRDRQKYDSSTLRTDGTNFGSSQASNGRSIYAGRFFWLGATWDATKQDQFMLGGSYNRFSGDTSSKEHNVTTSSDITRNGEMRWLRAGAGANFTYRHNFAQKDEDLTVDAMRMSSWGRSTSDYISLLTANDEPTYWQSRRARNNEDKTEFKIGYVLPLPDKGKFKIGYNLDDASTLTDTHGLVRNSALSDWADDPSYINYFVLNRTIHAGYVSYEQHFGDFGILGGLRVEQDFLHTDLKTTGETNDSDALGFYPSLHLSYNLTDTQMLRLSYSRRLNRPGTGNLNPARYSSDAFNVWSGNPHLKAEDTDSYEVSYRRAGEKSDFVLTGYYRATYKGITSVYRYLSPTVLLTTVDNLAHRMASGLEANFNQGLFEGVSLRSTATLAYAEINPGPLSVGKKQSGITWNIKGGIDWNITPDDLMQFNAKYSGKEKMPQGYRDPTYSGDLSYKHQFGSGLSGLLTINNLFDSMDRNSVLDSPGLHQVSHGTSPGRIFYFGLVYTFGGAKDVERPGESGAAVEGPPGGP